MYVFGCVGPYLQRSRPLIFLAACGNMCSIWDLVPPPEIKVGPHIGVLGVLATGPPGKLQEDLLYV